MKASSHLTRAVFRAIINNRPYVVAECRHTSQQALLQSARPLVPYTQRRTRMFGAIFGTLDRGFQGAKNTPKNLEIALGKIVDFVRARRSQSRGPSDEEVLDAFRFLFFSRLESQRRLTRNEVYLATEVFKHFQEKGLVASDTEGAKVTRDDLDNILKALALPSEKEKFRSDTRSLASLVFAALDSAGENITSTGSAQDSVALLPVYVTVLARTGSATEALKRLRQSKDLSGERNVQLWLEILKGLASEGRRNEFNTLLEEKGQQLSTLDPAEYEELMSFLASDDNFQAARGAYEHQLAANVAPSSKELVTLLDLSVRVNQFEFAKPIAQILETRIDEKDVLQTLLVWTAATNPDVETLRQEIGRILNIGSLDSVTMEPFNHLIEYGFSVNRPEIATAVQDIAQSIGLQPNGKFFALQLQYAIQRCDLADAADVYEEIVRHDIPADNSDIAILNKYVSLLAFSDGNYDILMRVIDNLLERNANFDAEALAGVCRVFLQRDELEDLTGLLRHRVDFYPGADRARISAVFQEFILDSSVKVERAFSAYELFRIAFPETPVEKRLPLMQLFFDRKRPDLACLVFGHMRQKEEGEARPTADAYAQCFAGIAQCRDVDGLQMVYNMLKLDLEVEVNTKVRNGLMLAYIACQMPYTAMIDHFWKIMDSREGPSYSTFMVAFRACESWIPQGGYEARKIMAIVQAWDLEITKEMYDCYIGAIAGQSEFENAIELIEEMEEAIGEGPDALTIGTFYNAIPWQYRKDEVEKWAQKAYPDLWEDLQSYGDEIDEEWEIRYFNIDRRIGIEDGPLFSDGEYDPVISRNAVTALEPPPEKSSPKTDLL